MERLDHKTAAVIIPPEDVWDPIQAIRQKHDSKVGRWMPHITLIYPFLPRSCFGRAAKELASACRSVKPFEIQLARFDHFGRGKGYFTLWLAPEPAEPIKDLHAALCPIAYEYEGDVDHAIGHFKPHLSIGQAKGMGNMVKLMEELQVGWKPIRFQVDSVKLIWRNDPPDDVFRIDRELPLQGE
jgi:2'-5' RNA ligase